MPSDIQSFKHFEEMNSAYPSDCPLSKEEFLGLWLLNAMLTSTHSLSIEEKQYASDFLANSINNNRLHYELQNKLAGMDLTNLISAANLILDLGFLTRRLNEFNDDFISRLEKMQTNIRNKEPIDYAAKISLHEYGLVHDIAKVETFFQILKLFDSEKLQSLKEHADLCHSFEKTLNLKIKIESHFHPTLFSHEEKITLSFGHAFNLVIKPIDPDQPQHALGNKP